MKKMFTLTLTAKQRELVSQVAHASTSAQSIALRARIILEAAETGNKSWVASKYAVGRDTVRLWCQRWQACQAELDEQESAYQAGTLSQSRYRQEIEKLLGDAERPGAPVTFTEEQKRQILAMASRKPEDEGVPVTHWSHDLLAKTVVDKGIVKTISPAHIGRFLKEGDPQASSKPVLGTSQH
jgi:putative transposase